MFLSKKKIIEKIEERLDYDYEFLISQIDDINYDLDKRISGAWEEITEHGIDLVSLENKYLRLSEEVDSLGEKIKDIELKNEVLSNSVGFILEELEELSKKIEGLSKKQAKQQEKEKDDKASQIIRDMQIIQSFSIDDALQFIMGEK